MSTTLLITAKGQVTFQRELLDHLGIGPGDKVVVDLLPSGKAELRAAPREPIDRFIGCLPDRGVRLSIEQINEAIRKDWLGRKSRLTPTFCCEQ